MARATVRLKDIATKTGFSTNTVSLALRDSPRIPKSTRDIIHATARALNYLPNQIAKSLVSRETKTIGLVLTDIMNPALTRTAQAMSRFLTQAGYGTLFAASHNILEEERRAIEMFRARQVDGMLIYPVSHRKLEYISPLRGANYPVVLLVSSPGAGIDTVSVDNRLGAYKATRHLIEMGHKRIGLIDGASGLGNRDKADGYRGALAEAGLELDARLVIDPHGRAVRDGYAAMDDLMTADRALSAVFATTDALALGALGWCTDNHVKVPEVVAIIGFDNVEFGAFAAPPLSSINYAAEEVAQRAVARLMTLIGCRDRLPAPEFTLIDPDLVVRRSTDSAK